MDTTQNLNPNRISELSEAIEWSNSYKPFTVTHTLIRIKLLSLLRRHKNVYQIE